MPVENTKTIFPHECPHCKKSLYIEMETPSPTLLGTITQEDVDNAKKMATERIYALGNLTAQARDEALAWVADEETIFGPSYVDGIIAELLNR